MPNQDLYHLIYMYIGYICTYVFIYLLSFAVIVSLPLHGMFAFKCQLLSAASTSTQSFVITSKCVKSTTTLNDDKRYFPQMSPPFCPPSPTHTHNLAHPKEATERTEIPFQAGYRLEADERRGKRCPIEVNLVN